jgi:hypothetical protein
MPVRVNACCAKRSQRKARAPVTIVYRLRRSDCIISRRNGEPDNFIGQEFQRPAGVAFGRFEHAVGDQQGFFLAGEVAVGAGERLLAERSLQVAITNDA